MSQYGYFNKNPGDQMYGTPFGHGVNNITTRGEGIPEFIQSKNPSKNMVEAHMRTLRFFRKMPMIIRIHEISYRVNIHQAKNNCAQYIRQRQHLREPQLVDFYVMKGYEFLYEAEWQICQHSSLFKFISPIEQKPNDKGYSYLEEKKYGEKSNFLKKFYIESRPNP